MRYKIIFILLSISLLLGACGDRKPHTILIDNTPVKIPVPAGYCLLSGQDELEGKIVKNLSYVYKERGKIYLVFANCLKLSLMRQEESNKLRDIAFVLVSHAALKQEFHTSPSEFVGIMKEKYEKEGESINQVQKATSNQMLDKAPAYQSSNIEHLGILGDDEYSVYVGARTKLKFNGVAEFEMISVGAASLVKSRFINFEATQEFKDDETIYNLYETMKKWINDVHDVN